MSKTQTPETSKKTSKRGRRVFLFGRLENEITLPVIERLLKLNERDGISAIDLYINSAGGNGYNADAIIATMHSLSAPVNTICLGHALSGACEILASGTGIRKAYEFATLMFHQTLWEADGDITNLEIQAAQGQKFREAQIELLHRCTKQDKKRLRTDIERDHYLSSPEAVQYGIIDQVIAHGSGERKATNMRKAAGASANNGRSLPKAASAGPKGKTKTANRPIIKRHGLVNADTAKRRIAKSNPQRSA